MPDRLTIGWDIGGAHLKAALLQERRVLDVVQLPCELWLGLDRLDAALDAVLQRWPEAQAPRAAHAATMTGELADGFEHRQQGVALIAARLAAHVGARLRWFGADGRWIDATRAEDEWAVIASANWIASARWLALVVPDALLVDVGSTTTDLIPIVDGALAESGRDDAARLASGALLYHGVVRTPLAAFGPRIAFRGVERNVMNELFATSADVYRLTGELDAAHDQHESADRAPKDRVATQRRLARMIGLDARDAGDAEWAGFAAAWRARQCALLHENALRVLSACTLRPDAPLIGAGCGDFLARALAASLQRPYRGIDALMPVDMTLAHWARVAAPCIAVALLATRDGVACGW